MCTLRTACYYRYDKHNLSSNNVTYCNYGHLITRAVVSGLQDITDYLSGSSFILVETDNGSRQHEVHSRPLLSSVQSFTNTLMRLLLHDQFVYAINCQLSCTT